MIINSVIHHAGCSEAGRGSVPGMPTGEPQGWRWGRITNCVDVLSDGITGSGITLKVSVSLVHTWARQGSDERQCLFSFFGQSACFCVTRLIVLAWTVCTMYLEEETVLKVGCELDGCHLSHLKTIPTPNRGRHNAVPFDFNRVGPDRGYLSGLRRLCDKFRDVDAR